MRLTDSGDAAEEERPASVGLSEGGEVVVGNGALQLPENRRASDFVEQLGRPEPFIVAGAPYGAEALSAQLIRALVDSLTASEGAVDAIALAYPDETDRFRLDLLVEASRLAAVGEIAFVPETLARGYADDVATGAAMWALDQSRTNHPAAPPPAGTPITARTALIGGGLVGGGVATVAGSASEAVGGAAGLAAFGSGASMADFGPSMETFGKRGRSMRAFIAAAVVAVVVVGGAAAVLATRGGGGDDKVAARNTPTTAANEPDLDDPVAVASRLDGSFELTTTVIDGNPAHPVGKKTTFTMAVTAKCTDSQCEVDIEDVGTTSLERGGEMRFAGPADEPCGKDPSITVRGTYEIVLRVTGFDAEGNVERLEGTNFQTVTDLAGCPDTAIDPIKFEWVLVRA